MISVQVEGTTLQFPDGTSAEVIKRKAKEYAASLQGAPKAIRHERAIPARARAPRTAAQDDGLDALRSLGAGFNRGITSFLNLPSAIVNSGMQALGVPPEWAPGRTPEEAQQDASAVMAMQGPSDTFGERLAGRFGEFMGSAGPVGMVFPPATIPGLLGETALMGTAALGGQAAEEAGGGPLAQAAAEMAGGLAPAGAFGLLSHGLIGQVGRRGARLVSAIRGGQPTEAERVKAMRRVSEEIRTEMTPEAQQNVTEAQSVAQQVPGFQPTLGQATNLPSIIRREADVGNRLTGGNLNEMVSRRESNMAALLRVASEGGPAGNPADLMALIDDRLGEVRARVGMDEADLARTAQAAAPGLVNRADAGHDLRVQLAGQAAAAREEYRALRAEVGNDPVDFGPVRDDVRGVLNDIVEELRDQAGGNVAGRVARRPVPEGAPDTIQAQDLLDLRREINRRIVPLRDGQNADYAQLGVLYAAKRAVDDAINTLPEPQAAAFWTANDFYRTVIGPRFRARATPAARALRTAGGWQYALPDEQVAAVFFRPDKQNGISAIRQFRTIFAGDQRANADLLSVALDDLSRAAVRDGALEPRAFASWVRSHASVIREFPELQQAIASRATILEGVARRQATLAARREKIEGAALVKLLGKEPAQLAEEFATSSKSRRAILAAVRRSPEGQAGLRRALWDRASAEVMRDPEAFLSYLQTQGRDFPLSQAHRTSLEAIARGLMIEGRVPVPRGRAIPAQGAAGPLKEELGTSFPSLASMLWAVKNRRTPARYALSVTAMRALDAQTIKESDRLWREALMDPQVAQDIANYVKAPSESKARRIRGYMLAIGIPSIEEQK